MKCDLWFYTKSTLNALEHRYAYEESVKSGKCVKVHSGSYYYKGFHISCNGGDRTYKWGWSNPHDNSTCWERSKKDCINAIKHVTKLDSAE